MLPNKEWLKLTEIADYLEVDVETARKSMGLPITEFTKKIHRVHIEDFRQWELEKRASTGASRFRGTAKVSRLPPKHAQKQRLSKRSLSNATNEDELASLLNIQYKKAS
jgi:hypothetical protein